MSGLSSDAVAIFRMGLFDVGAIKIDTVFVGAVDFVQAHGLITKWGSRIGPHQQRNRSAKCRGQSKHFSGALAIGVEALDLEVGCFRAHSGRALVPIGLGGLVCVEFLFRNAPMNPRLGWDLVIAVGHRSIPFALVLAVDVF